MTEKQYPFNCITDFIFVENKPSKADVILVAGGSRPQLAERAVDLFNEGHAPYILFSGGTNEKLTDFATEYEYLRDIAISKGVPEKAFLKEDQAKHTFDNATFSWKVLQESSLDVQKVILVTKAHHSRRALLTYQTVFPLAIEFVLCPVIDEREIRKDDWFLDGSKIDVVMKEVKKIGQYFGKHIPNWI